MTTRGSGLADSAAVWARVERANSPREIARALMLLKTVRSTASFGDTDPAVTEAVRLSAATILADVTGTTPHADPGEWRRWIFRHGVVKPVQLAAPPAALR